MSATLDEIIAKKKQKELEAAQIAEKLTKAKRYKELKRRRQNAAISSSTNSLPPVSCSTGSTTQQHVPSNQTFEDKENSSNVLSAKITGTSSKHSKDLHTDSKLLRKAGALVRNSQDPHTPIWVPGFSYPAQYCIRQTRSLSQKLQVDNVDCIDLDDCMFGSQRTKVKGEDSKSDSGGVKSEQTVKPVRRKKRRRRSNKLSQTSDSSNCGTELVSEQRPTVSADGDNTMPSSCGGLLMEGPAAVVMPVTQRTPPVRGDSNTTQLLMGGNDSITKSFTPECDEAIPSAQQPMECDGDILIQMTKQPTLGIGTPLLQHHTEVDEVNKSSDSPMQENSVQQSVGSDDNTLYGLTDSMLLLIDTSCDQQTRDVDDACDQDPGDTCRFWCEQGSDLNSKVTLSKDNSSFKLHCDTILKHSVGSVMTPLVRISNIALSTTPDESVRVYVAVQLTGYIVVWVDSFGWTVLSHWPVTDEADLIHFSTLSLIGGMAVCTIAVSGTCRVSFVRDSITSEVPKPVVHCTSSDLWHSRVMCCWTNKSEVLIAISCKDKIVVQTVKNYSEKVKKQLWLPFDTEVCSLCGVENNSSTSDDGAWLLAATPTGMAIFDIVKECLLQYVLLTCSTDANSLFPNCLRAIREDCYTFIVLGYEYQKNNCSVVGWLVAIDNSDDTRMPLLTSDNQKASYAKLLREYTLPQSPSSSDSFDYLNAVHNNQLVVAIPTTSSRLHIWDQFTGEVTSNWTVSGCAEFLVQCNSTVLVLYDKDDQGNLYTYGLDKM